MMATGNNMLFGARSAGDDFQSSAQSDFYEYILDNETILKGFSLIVESYKSADFYTMIYTYQRLKHVLRAVYGELFAQE